MAGHPPSDVQSICSGTTLQMDNGDDIINIQIFVPELQMRKCLTVSLDDLVWDVKRKLHAVLTQPLPQAFNYGLFLPPCDGRAGKFLLEDRPIRDYPFHDCVPYLELKYKKRVYKMLHLDEKQLRNLHTKSNLKKFMDYVMNRNTEKVEKWSSLGVDANFHDANGETPLTVAAGITNNRGVIMALVGGGAHIDFRNTEGQTAMHKASFLSSVENVKTLLELGASPNYRDMIGLTPLYYNMLTADSNEQVAEMLLREAAEMGVTDMHGNHEIHQGCKNGLIKHVEHLLYYGAQADAENINGNTPLHVCAVNNRPECARVLLFRGANHVSVNKQGQTALHVAHIVGSTPVAEVIASHTPGQSVPYRGTPQYSTRRRLSTSTLSRRRSLSQSSLCSAQHFGGEYRVPQPVSTAPSPSPSRVSGSEYGTMRRYAPEHVKAAGTGHEPNIPRILVIPRGPKGFGFILRGAKHAEAAINFEPSPMVPGLQFFEGVDMSGMAMRAGLRPGDFLLQIDGVDVTRASHEEVVRLIQAAGDTITLKVITVDPNSVFPQSNYRETSRQRHHSVGRSSGLLPPQPPQRLPSTSLSMRQPATSYRMLHHSATVGDMDEYYSPGRCASVAHRPTASRRISAAELESLMIRQNAAAVAAAAGGPSTFQPVQYDQESLNGSQTPKKFTSVADMKRRKHNQLTQGRQPTGVNTGLPRVPYDYQSTSTQDSRPQQPINSIYGSPMKTYSSSPDIAGSTHYAEGCGPGSECSDYSRPFRPTSRPKTPPPPPPPSNYATPPSSSSTTTLPPVVQPANLPPPPPPPPPQIVPKVVEPARVAVAPPPPPPLPPSDFKPSSSSQGITADALKAVKLNKTPSVEKTEVKPIASSSSSSGSDFHADLRNALAKRRSKVAMEDDDDDKTMHGSVSSLSGLSLRESVRETVPRPPPSSHKPQHSPPGNGVVAGSFAAKKDSGYTSSRTSLEPSECGESAHPNSASTSPHPHFTIDDDVTPPTTGHRVALISAQIEDSCYATSATATGGRTRTIDTMSVNSTLSTLSGCSSTEMSSRRIIEPPLPPIDYDDPDSGTGDSDGDSHHGLSAAEAAARLSGKCVSAWNSRDVVAWLSTLSLHQDYAHSFIENNITGSVLCRIDRSLFTSLGVTRIAHRQRMEHSIKEFISNQS